MKLIEVMVDASQTGTIAAIAEQQQAIDFWAGPPGDDKRCLHRLLLRPENTQAALDTLQSTLSGVANARLTIYPVEATLPRPVADEKKERAADDDRKEGAQITREELYENVDRGARLNSTYLVMVVLSTIVASIGLIADNVAVVIGAMVIAPLLGPNLALALGAALGDSDLVARAFKTGIAGLVLAMALAAGIGWLWPVPVTSHEILSRTVIDLDSVALALASGAAAVLSLTTAVPMALVGVMVAVALLPPTATVGLMLGSGHAQLATGAALLLAVNIVCVNLSANIVFLLRGVKPRTWIEKRKARQSLVLAVTMWAIMLAVLVAAIFLLREVNL